MNIKCTFKQPTPNSKTDLFKMNRFLFQGALTRFLFNSTRFLFKNGKKIEYGVKGQIKSLILVRNIKVGFLCLFAIFPWSFKLLFDLLTLIQFTIFEKEPCIFENETCRCPSEEEYIHF